MKYLVCLCVLSFVVIAINGAKDGFNYATCVLQSDSNSTVQGTVDFRQAKKGGVVQFKLDISGFETKGSKMHGFHVHSYGTIQNGCAGAGGHYNPLNKKHGAPDNSKKRRHVGDLGNIKQNRKGFVKMLGSDKLISLTGAFNIQGRAVVVHALKDDLGRGGDAGSMATGNAGARLACCVIVASNDSRWP